MSPATPQYQPIPSTPSHSEQATPIYSTTNSTPSSSRRRYSDSPGTRNGLLASPIPLSLRFRPIPLILAFMVLAILSGSFIHPTPRSYISTYLSSSGSDTSSSSLASNVPPPSGGIPAHLNVPMTLEARLHHLLSRPALWQWEAELPSRHKCPFYTFNRNTYFFHDGKPEQWEQITPTDVKRYRNKIVEYMRDIEREGGKLVWEDGMDADVPVSDRRGVIYTVGDGVSSLSFS